MLLILIISSEGKSLMRMRLFCRISQSNNLTFASTGVDVNQYCQNNKLSLEEGARILRYQYLRTLAQQHQADKIVGA